MSSLLRIAVIVLALLVFLASSRAATLCVERDGNARLELVGAACCAGPSAAPTAGTTIGATPCAGCDDAPFRVTGRLVTSSSASAELAARLVTLSAEPAALPVPDAEPSARSSPLAREHAGQPSPRDSRPARLRC